MAELVLIKAIVGSRAATVLCPHCGRISRQILSKSFDESIKAELLREYECPLCKSTYRECSSAWSTIGLPLFCVTIEIQNRTISLYGRIIGSGRICSLV